jgi:hypothetical protein
MLMYTSCGWFFDALAGLEPVQNLKYAALALRYFAQLGGGALEGEFIRRLAAAPGDGATFIDGADVYRKLVRPAVVAPERVVATYAITGLVEEHPDETRVYAYGVSRLDETGEAYADTQVRIGHARVTFEVTGETREAAYALLRRDRLRRGRLPADEGRPPRPLPAPQHGRHGPGARRALPAPDVLAASSLP